MSKKLNGIHIYVNINNLNSIIKKEENNTDSLTRTFHSLNTYVCTMEKFAQFFHEIVTVEKFTTTRLHFYITTDKGLEIMNKAFIQLSYFSKQLADSMKSIGKYNKLAPFEIGIGADYGQFVEFEFKDKNTDVEELTTIGSPANRAAKLQSKSKNNEIIISKKLYEILPSLVKNIFFGASDVTNEVSSKYYDILPLRAKISNLGNLVDDSYEHKANECLRYANELAQKNNLGAVNFSDARVPVDFEQLSLLNAKKVNGVMLYADIRNFTQKVDNTPLDEIETFTERVLKGMYCCVNNNDGLHVQFQGDRESGILHHFKEREESFIIDALITAMKLLDFVDAENNSKNHKEHLDIGIGCSIGDIYFSRLGIKNNKFNIAMGETVQEADYAEDVIAGSFGRPTSEIAITKELFKALGNCNSKIATTIKKEFRQCGDNFYVCATRYSTIKSEIETNSLVVNPLAKYGCDISHREKPKFALPKSCSFSIKAEIINDYSKIEYKSNSYPLEKNINLLFSPLYNVPEACYVKWQITNTGYEAKNDLRGSFEKSNERRLGKDILRKEHTSYSGRHLVQCFVMRSANQCVAMSDCFIVWIK